MQLKILVCALLLSTLHTLIVSAKGDKGDNFKAKENKQLRTKHEETEEAERRELQDKQIKQRNDLENNQKLECSNFQKNKKYERPRSTPTTANEVSAYWEIKNENYIALQDLLDKHQKQKIELEIDQSYETELLNQKFQLRSDLERTERHKEKLQDLEENQKQEIQARNTMSSSQIQEEQVRQLEEKHKQQTLELKKLHESENEPSRRKQEQRYTIQEILSSDLDFMETIEFCINTFKKPTEDKNTSQTKRLSFGWSGKDKCNNKTSQDNEHPIFWNMEVILAYHQNGFLKKLIHPKYQNIPFLCKVLNTAITDNELDIYIGYSKNYLTQAQTLSAKSPWKKLFGDIETKLVEADPKVDWRTGRTERRKKQGITLPEVERVDGFMYNLQSYLPIPYQKLPKYLNLLDTLIKTVKAIDTVEFVKDCRSKRQKKEDAIYQKMLQETRDLLDKYFANKFNPALMA